VLQIQEKRVLYFESKKIMRRNHMKYVPEKDLSFCNKYRIDKKTDSNRMKNKNVLIYQIMMESNNL
jgi:hypothetical protein